MYVAFPVVKYITAYNMGVCVLSILFKRYIYVYIHVCIHKLRINETLKRLVKN